jgi:hypothetical protein
MRCPNELYVACTRASEHLILIHDSKHNYLPFLNINNIKLYSNFRQEKKLSNDNDYSSKYSVAVTKLFNHLPEDIIDDCMKYLTVTKISNKIINVKFKSKINDKYGYENVSDITGTAIPAYYELLHSDKMTIYNYLKANYDPIYDTNFIDDEVKKPDVILDIYSIDLMDIKPHELLYIANRYCSQVNVYRYKMYQITNYDWLSTDKLNTIINEMKKLNISKNAKFEYGVRGTILDIELCGYIDCVDDTNIYEFKCIDKLTNEHILQLAIYMYLYESELEQNTRTKRYFLYSLLTGETIEISATYESVKEMIQELIISKNKLDDVQNEETFIENNTQIFNKYLI